MRSEGYAPLRSYAAVGDGRTIALIARDGAVDWLPWPDLDSPSVFAAVVDAEHGGAFRLTPSVPFSTKRRYLPGTNVLETRFLTGVGEVRLIDAMSLGGDRLGPSRELQRRIAGVSGTVPMVWTVRPRFGYGQLRTRLGWRGPTPVATSGSDALAVCAFEAGTPAIEDGAVSGSFQTVPGSAALIALSGAHQEPLVFPTRGELDERYAHTLAHWRTWSDSRTYDGPWPDAVLRSALALKLL